MIQAVTRAMKCRIQDFVISSSVKLLGFFFKEQRSYQKKILKSIFLKNWFVFILPEFLLWSDVSNIGKLAINIFHNHLNDNYFEWKTDINCYVKCTSKRKIFNFYRFFENYFRHRFHETQFNFSAHHDGAFRCKNIHWGERNEHLVCLFT